MPLPLIAAAGGTVGGGAAASYGAAASTGGGAAAARIGGAATRSASAQQIAAAGRTRNAAGQFTSANSGKEVSQGLGDIWNTMKKIEIGPLKNLKKIWTLGKKILSVLEKASPALAQQLTIMRKAITLPLRAIGDIMAKFLRPMAIWMIKVGMKLYEWLGGGGDADNSSAAALEDKKEGLESELISAQSAGDTDRVADILSQLDDLNKELENAPRFWKDLWKDTKAVFQYAWDIIKQPFSDLADLATWVWDGLKAGFGKLDKWLIDTWNDTILPAIKNIDGWLAELWKDYVVAPYKKLDGWLVDLWDTYVVESFKKVDSWLANLWTDYVVEPYKKLDSWLINLWDTYVVEPFKKFDGWVSELWTDIKKAFSSLITKIKSWRPFTKSGNEDVGGNAAGGAITETGMYKLHAGERVLTAGDASRVSSSTSSSNSNSTNIVNHYHIAATVNNDIDIQQLARKLSIFNETEMRRRVSYV